MLGVPKENLIFANLTQSPIEGPTKYSVHDVARAKEIFKKAILSLPKNAAVIAPAQGEAHVDHRTVREVTLQVICEAGRKDLIVYECPEYNAFLSLIHCPMRTIRTILDMKRPIVDLNFLSISTENVDYCAYRRSVDVATYRH